MARIFGLEFGWEAIQTAGAFLLGKARSNAGAQATASATEAPLKQQMATVLPSRNDEAMQSAIDAGLVEITGGRTHLERIQRVRKALTKEQREDWRLNLCSLALTERFEIVTVSETITRTNPGEPDDTDAPLNPRRRNARTGQERIDRKFDRRPRDYEWTKDDPRIKHLILVSQFVDETASPVGTAEEKEKAAVAPAIAYLLTAGMIKEKYPKQIAAEATAIAVEKVAAVSYYSVARMQLGNDVFQRIMALPEGDARDQALSTALDQKRQQMARQLEETKASGLPRWFWITLLCLGIIGFLFAL